MFEVGKTYRTRGGGTATVTAVAETGFVAENSNGAGGFYTPKGRYWTDEYEHPFDLLPGAIEDTHPEPVETLRDRFAMAALTGICASDEHLKMAAQTGVGVVAALAGSAYEMADAILAEREKPHGR